MVNRAPDRLAQAERDLDHARHSVAAGDYEWACFAAQQAAENAVKGALLALGGEGWGHGVTRLLTDFAQHQSVVAEIVDAARRLDKHYMPTRYPNGFPAGSPKDYYTSQESEQAIADATAILPALPPVDSSTVRPCSKRCARRPAEPGWSAPAYVRFTSLDPTPTALRHHIVTLTCSWWPTRRPTAVTSTTAVRQSSWMFRSRSTCSFSCSPKLRRAALPAAASPRPRCATP